MFAPPPKTIRIVINSINSKDLANFYSDLGMLFNEKSLENGNKCYTYIYDDFYFEIREVLNENEITKNLELRFFIDEIEGYIEVIEKFGLEIIKNPWTTENYQHILLKDPNDNIIELVTKK